MVASISVGVVWVVLLVVVLSWLRVTMLVLVLRLVRRLVRRLSLVRRLRLILLRLVLMTLVIMVMLLSGVASVLFVTRFVRVVSAATGPRAVTA